MLEIRSTNIPTETGACDPGKASRQKFESSFDNVTLWVPSWIEDKKIRWCLDHGDDLYGAYQKANASDIYPPEGLRACVRNALKTKYCDPTQSYYDPSIGRYIPCKMERSGGIWTCISFHQCFEDFIEAKRDFPEEKAGRIEIVPGIYCPNPTEQECIKAAYVSEYPNVPDLRTVYIDCGAGDIIPEVPNILRNMSIALYQDRSASLYDILKALCLFSAIPPSFGPHSAHDLPHHAPPEEEKKKDYKWLYYVGGGIVGLMLLSQR